MPDFSTIAQSPQMRAIVQQNLLERAFHDALFPKLLFRSETAKVPWPLHAGDTQVFTGAGIIEPNAAPLRNGVDPDDSSYTMEQWTAQIQTYAGSIQTNMPSSITAIVDLFMRNAHQLGMMAGMSLNRKVRDVFYNAAESGHTMANGAQGPTTSLVVWRLNGFTRARNPNLPNGSPVTFSQVSSSNPLTITIAGSPNTVIGYTSVTPGDEFGPGTLLLGSSVTAADLATITSADATFIDYVGGAASTAGITGSNVITLADVRTIVADMQQNNVPQHPDMRDHAHLDPTSVNRLFGDSELQRLNTALPDYYMYKDFVVGEILGTLMIANTECPIASTVVGGKTGTYSQNDPFAPLLFSNGNPATGVPLHRVLFTAQGAANEYHQDQEALITEAGITGVIAEPNITNNAIQVYTDGIELIIRAPLNKLQDQVTTSWRFVGDWPVRTDAATGSDSRYKRTEVVVHA